MIKSEMIQKLFEATKIPRKAAELAVNTIFDTMTDALSKSEGIEIRGFGTFKVKDRKARIARNPRTGDSVPVPPRKVPVFKVSKELKDMVAQG